MRIIPQPKEVHTLPDIIRLQEYRVDSTHFHDRLDTIEKHLTDILGKKPVKDSGILIHILKNDFMKTEEYKLSVIENSIGIAASTYTGVFYALQSLRQMVVSKDKEETIIQCGIINDFPAFEWRGLHIDVCRHFFSIEFIKKQLDLMALYKLNKFHWHLTEDQGWRIEIKKYPKLTSHAGWRKEKDGTVYGGFYTQKEIKEVVAYAEKLSIDVIPEIELPGHAQAALSAYPEYSCTGMEMEVWNDWGVSDEVYCAGKDSTFEFLRDIIDEVCELFPSKYFHIGGDECPKTRWKECPDCRKRIQEEDLKNEEELQSWFIRQIEKHLLSKGKALIGWDEILEGGLADTAVVMSWRGIGGGVAAVQHGNQAIMTPWANLYFDKRPFPEDKKVNLPILSWEDVYKYNPIPEELNTEQRKLILGAQANIWTEHIYTENEFEYMLIPRIFSLSEIVWTTDENKDFESFKSVIEKHLKYLRESGYDFESYRQQVIDKIEVKNEEY